MPRRSPRLAAKAAALAKVFEPRRSIRIAIQQARAEQQERAEVAISRIQNVNDDLLRAAATLPMVDPVEQLYYTDCDKFFEEVDFHTEVQRLKFIKNLYIKRGIFQPCQDLIIPQQGYLTCLLIKIKGASYWLCGALVLELRNENIDEPFFHVGDVWDDHFKWEHDSDSEYETGEYETGDSDSDYDSATE